MANLILGPMLRHVGERDATVWVETSAPCEVEIRGHTERTFTIEGHHYALVCLDDLEPATTYPYEVALDGERRWPADERFPEPTIRTLDPDGKMELAFGSCRVSLPHEFPYTLSKDDHEMGAEVCALRVRALEMLRQDPEDWPDLLLWLGDQVYVDEGALATRRFIRARRDTSVPPGDGPIDYEEYARLYWEAWSEPTLRWMASVVPVAMIIDDHDIHDDWNISRSWVEEIQATEWWPKRLLAGYMSYWVYQHLGNLSPERLADDETFRAVREAGDGTEALREYAHRAEHDRRGILWSYRRNLGRTRLIVMDSRGGRVLENGRRSIFDDEEREWVFGQAEGDFDHLLIATSDPFLLAHSLDDLEAWNEAVADGAWGRGMAKVAEAARRAADFDHWAAFQISFGRLSELLRSVGAGERGEPPASIVVLSGDVHHAYLAEVGFRRGAGVRSRVYQAVCSPYRNPLNQRERRVIRTAWKRVPAAITRALRRAAGVEDPPIGWRLREGPFFDNQIATLTLRGRRADIRLEKTVPGETDEDRLRTSFERRLV